MQTGRLLLAYLGGILKNMTTKNLTTDQKVDLLISQFAIFDKKLDILGAKINKLEVKIDKLEIKVDKMQKDITDLIELTSSAMNLAAVTSDRIDKLENKKSFTGFTKGAFVA